MARLNIESICKTYPNGANAVNGINLDVADGEFIVLVGPSGCGKSTLLRMIAGLEEITSGEVSIDGRIVNDVEPASRDIAMVFQNYALYPHMNVFDNMSYGLKNRKMPRAEIDRRVREVAQLLELEQLLERRPKQLSGGQRQRVAMGRAIVRSPKAFLFDEPLSNLDAKLRVQMRVEIRKLQRDLGTTSIYVTHDQVEAMTMGDRVAVLKSGVLQQVDSPRALYDEPANAFVATFIGSPSMNIVPSAVTSDGLKMGDHTVPMERSRMDQVRGGTALLGIRPEDLHITDSGATMTVTLVEELGADTFVYGDMTAADGSTVNLVARDRSHAAPRMGETVHVAPERTYLFQSDGVQERIV